MTPLYSQNGDLIYPSDSEESLPATSTSNTDNRATSPNSHDSVSSPTPTSANQPKIPTANSPGTAGSCVPGRTESFSPRYSPPAMANHLENHSPVPSSTTPQQIDTNTLSAAAVPSHMDSLSAMGRSAQPDMINSQHQQTLGMNVINSQSINSQAGGQLGMTSMSHQIYKTSPQSSPSAPQHYDAMSGYTLPTNTGGYEQLTPQYQPHTIAQLTQNQSRCWAPQTEHCSDEFLGPKFQIIFGESMRYDVV